MKKFSIEIEEILQRVEEVEAKDIEEALEKVEEQYSKDEIVLDYNDFKGYEIREYIDGVKEQKLEKDAIFDIKNGKAILLEGNNELALIKKLRVDYCPYVVVSGLAVNKNNTHFEWKQCLNFQTLTEANEKFEELGGYKKTQSDLVYSEVGEFTLGRYDIVRFNNVDEAFDSLVDENISKEQLIDMMSEKAKKETVLGYIDVVVIQDGKYYFGNDFYFFEDEINEKTRKIDKILNELNIKDVKTYDVIELLERRECEFIDKELEENIANAIATAGYKKDIEDFINYINEELYKEKKKIEEKEQGAEL